MFRENLRKLMVAKGYTAKELAQKIEALTGGTDKKLYRIVENWTGKRSSTPRADMAVSIAKALGTTVEYLVDGESGSDYVHDLIAQEGRLWKPPERIKRIVFALEALDDKELETIQKMVEGLSGEGRSEQKVQG